MTDDVLRTLVVAVFVLGVNRVLVMPHTDCGMTKVTDDDIHDLARAQGVDTRSLDFHTVPDQNAALRHDLIRIRTSPFLDGVVSVGGAIYDVRTGKLTPIEELRRNAAA